MELGAPWHGLPAREITAKMAVPLVAGFAEGKFPGVFWENIFGRPIQNRPYTEGRLFYLFV